MSARGTDRLREEASLLRRHLRLRRTAQGRLLREISAGMEGTPPPRRRRRTGSVWMVAVVRDEADVVEEFVRHHRAQGVEGMLLADNGSRDGTGDLLRDLARADPGIVVLQDRLRAFHQGAKITCLARLAGRAGADWVVPADADERWVGEDDVLARALDRAGREGYDIVAAEVHNAYPASEDPAGPWRWDPAPHATGKVALRAHPLAEVSDGSHWARRPGRRTRGLHLVHLPWRSRAQLGAKITKGSAGLAAAGLDAPGSGVDGHWGQMSRLSPQDLDRIWAEIRGGPVSGLDFGYRPGRHLLPLASTHPRTWRSATPDPEEAPGG